MCDGFPNEVQGNFTQKLKTTRNDIAGFDSFVEPGSPEPKNHNNQHHDNQPNHHDSVYRKWGVSESDYLGVELEDGRGAVPTILCPKQAQHTKQRRSPGPSGILTSAR